MIGVLRGLHLIRAREILMRLPILFDGAKTGVETGAFDAIAPDAVARSHQKISPGPSMVGDAARFVRIQCGDAAIVFCAGGNAVDEYVMVETSFLSREREAHICFVVGLHVEVSVERGVV